MTRASSTTTTLAVIIAASLARSCHGIGCNFCGDVGVTAPDAIVPEDVGGPMSCQDFAALANSDLFAESPDDPLCGFIMGQQSLCCPEAMTDVEMCTFCPGGITAGDNYELPMDETTGETITCGEMAQAASIFPADDFLCEAAKITEMVCCPTDDDSASVIVDTDPPTRPPAPAATRPPKDTPPPTPEPTVAVTAPPTPEPTNVDPFYLVVAQTDRNLPSSSNVKVLYKSANVEYAKAYMMTEFPCGYDSNYPQRMIVEVIDNTVQAECDACTAFDPNGNPFKQCCNVGPIAGQGQSLANGFNQFWWGREEIYTMVMAATQYVNSPYELEEWVNPTPNEPVVPCNEVVTAVSPAPSPSVVVSDSSAVTDSPTISVSLIKPVTKAPTAAAAGGGVFSKAGKSKTQTKTSKAGSSSSKSGKASKSAKIAGKQGKSNHNTVQSNIQQMKYEVSNGAAAEGMYAVNFVSVAVAAAMLSVWSCSM